MKSTVYQLLLLVQWVVSQGNIPSSDGGTGLSQIDLEAFKEVTVCTKQTKPLSCSYPGSDIAITNVFWGRRSASICPSDDGDVILNCDTAPETEGIVKAKCEGKESCELEARHAVLQNPKTSHCPGVNKYLTVNYTCVPDAKEVVLCDSENSTLNCPASWKIGVNSVFWGRQSTSVCPSDSGLTTCTGAPESLEIVRKSCDGLPRCDIHASYDQVQNGAENCPHISKYLIINYSCRPHPNIKTEEESEVKQFTLDENQVNDDQAQKTTETVESALKQLDGEQKDPVQSPAESKEDLNIGRLGMGGLKALEKINNLIKASAESQGSDDQTGVENGLTDEQAQTIERMIIEGIRNIKKHPTTTTGTRKTSIPRRAGIQKTPNVVVTSPKVTNNRNIDTSKLNRQKVQSTITKIHDNKPLPLKTILRSPVSKPKPAPAVNQIKKPPTPNNERQKIQRLPNIGGGLGIGNAGTGNEP